VTLRFIPFWNVASHSLLDRYWRFERLSATILWEKKVNLTEQNDPWYKERRTKFVVNANEWHQPYRSSTHYLAIRITVVWFVSQNIVCYCKAREWQMNHGCERGNSQGTNSEHVSISPGIPHIKRLMRPHVAGVCQQGNFESVMQAAYDNNASSVQI
jgi:hypothetical protein